MGKTLKTYSYRGINVYVRWLGGLWYECLIAFKGGIYAHQLQLLKPQRAERRNSLEERHEGAKGELMFIAASLIDDLHEKNKWSSKIKTKLHNAYEQIKRTGLNRRTGESAGV